MRAQLGQLTSAAAEFMVDTPMYLLYQRVAPRPEDFGPLLDKIGVFMATETNLESRLAELRVPTLFVSGDADMFPPSYAARQFELMGGGLRDGGWMGEGRAEGGHALAILPRQTHYSIFRSPLLAAVALAFLDEEPG
jgi:pimeloyl-ACP methyl ester carboxylesterase